MKKGTAILISSLAILVLLIIATQAFFGSQAGITSLALGSGTLQLNMKLEDSTEVEIGGLFDGDKIWIPGDNREALCTIENTGSLPVRWRLGVAPDATCDPALLDNIIFTWYRSDASGTWKMIRSDTLDKYLIDGSGGGWLMDNEAAPAAVFDPLAAGQSQKLMLLVDFELSAMSPLQGAEFKGRLLLQGAQVSREDWFPAAEIPLSVKGDDV